MSSFDRISSVVIFLVVLFHSALTSEETNKNFAFECKPKPGCNLGSCIDIPSHIRQLSGFNEDFYRKANEYHLECKPKENEYIRNYASMKMLEDFKKKFRKEMKEMNEKFEELEKSCACQTNEKGNVDKKEPSNKEEKKVPCDGVVHQNKCFVIAEASGGYPRPKTFFVKLCAEKNGYLANVYDMQHYNKLANYVRKTIGNDIGNSIVYIGMRYSYKKRSPVFRNGKVGGKELPWFPGYPKHKEDEDAILMSISLKLNEKLQGVFNFEPKNSHYHAICEI